MKTLTLIVGTNKNNAAKSCVAIEGKWNLTVNDSIVKALKGMLERITLNTDNLMLAVANVKNAITFDIEEAVKNGYINFKKDITLKDGLRVMVAYQ